MHPDDGLLVAYIRHQPCDDKREEIQRHIEGCTTCQMRSAEYERTGELLEAWSRTYAYRTYPSLSEHVMRHVQSGQFGRESEQVARVAQGRVHQNTRVSWRVLSLPLALLLLLLLSAVIALAHLSGSTVNTSMSTVTQGTAVQSMPGMTALPAHQTTPTPTTVPTTATTVVSGPAGPSISECTSDNDSDAGHTRIRICGVNFTPKSRVYLILYLPDGHVKQRKSLLTDGHGQFQDVITITKCKDVPVEIVAQSVAKPTEQSQPLRNIQFGNCPVPQMTATPA